MLDQLLRLSAVARLRVSLFGPWLDTYAARLLQRGNNEQLIRRYVYAVEHFGCWLKRHHIAPADIELQTIREFLHKHLPKCRCVHPGATHLKCNELMPVRAALHHLLQLPPFVDNAKAKMVPPSNTDLLLAEFDRFLLQVAGLAEETRRERRRSARDFLKAAASRRAVNWAKLQPRDVAVIFSRHVAHLRPASIKGAASCVRSFLRFLRITGRCNRDLTGAIPSMPRRSLASLPRYLSEKQLHVFIRQFERRTRKGRRDYAIALCLVELGLRTGEVVALQLDDVNWRAGTMRIVGGKNRRDRELPLPQAIGQAITAYLQKGRPQSVSRQLFLHHRRFFKGDILTSNHVHRLMGRALKKVPGYEQFKGAHVLRHTAATRLFQRGVPLKIVADLLGHLSIDTTQIYTKVDVPILAKVALPWPEVRP